MNPNDERIEEILNSAEGMRRAAMPAELQEKIMRQIPAGRRGRIMFSPVTILKIAAGIILLAGLNISALYLYGEPDSYRVTTDANPLTAEYFIAPPSI